MDETVVKLRLHGPQTGFDIPETFAMGQVGKGHAAELVETPKPLHFLMAPIPIDTLLEVPGRKEFHDLREDRLSRIHGPILWSGWIGRRAKGLWLANFNMPCLEDCPIEGQMWRDGQSELDGDLHGSCSSLCRPRYSSFFRELPIG
jgi:hypothetical protein